MWCQAQKLHTAEQAFAALACGLLHKMHEISHMANLPPGAGGGPPRGGGGGGGGVGGAGGGGGGWGGGGGGGGGGAGGYSGDWVGREGEMVER